MRLVRCERASAQERTAYRLTPDETHKISWQMLYREAGWVSKAKFMDATAARRWCWRHGVIFAEDVVPIPASDRLSAVS